MGAFLRYYVMNKARIMLFLVALCLMATTTMGQTRKIQYKPSVSSWA